MFLTAFWKMKNLTQNQYLLENSEWSYCPLNHALLHGRQNLKDQEVPQQDNVDSISEYSASENSKSEKWKQLPQI